MANRRVRFPHLKRKSKAIEPSEQTKWELARRKEKYEAHVAKIGRQLERAKAIQTKRGSYRPGFTRLIESLQFYKGVSPSEIDRHNRIIYWRYKG